jgi:predicted lipoprotein
VRARGRAGAAALAGALLVLAAALLALAATCAPVPLGDGPRRQTVRALAEQVVRPSLDATAARAAELRAAARALADAPSQATLDAARAAWRAARAPWRECDAFSFGPATDDRLAVAIDQLPVDPDKIEQEIAGAADLTADHVETIGANRKGFHAIEHLVFRADGDDAAVLASLTTDPLAPRRRQLVAALAENLERKVQELVRAWAPDGGGYAEVVAAPGASNSEYPTIKAVIDAFVNTSVFLAELVSDARIGKPLGLASGGAPQPTLEESGPSDNSLADMAGSVRGLRAVYTGARGGGGGAGGGISALVAAQSPALDREVRGQIDLALAAIEAIPRPFRAALTDHRAEVQAAYDAMKELKHLLGTEVLSVLGATLKFNDNDGD